MNKPPIKFGGAFWRRNHGFKIAYFTRQLLSLSKARTLNSALPVRLKFTRGYNQTFRIQKYEIWNFFLKEVALFQSRTRINALKTPWSYPLTTLYNLLCEHKILLSFFGVFSSEKKSRFDGQLFNEINNDRFHWIFHKFKWVTTIACYSECSVIHPNRDYSARTLIQRSRSFERPISLQSICWNFSHLGPLLTVWAFLGA